MEDVNSVYFSKEMVEAGEMHDFVRLLMAQSYGHGKLYNDIHIKPEDFGAFIIEWAQLPWDHAYGGSFQYISEGKKIVDITEFEDGDTDEITNGLQGDYPAQQTKLATALPVAQKSMSHTSADVLAKKRAEQAINDFEASLVENGVQQ